MSQRLYQWRRAIYKDKLDMCLAIPGKIVSIKGQLAIVDFDGIEKEINVGIVEVNKGDYIMVHAGFAIERMEESEVESIKAYLKADKNG